MKQLFFALLMALISPFVSAQETTDAEHLLFEGVAMSGDIFAFSKTLLKKGYKQQQRDQNQRFYVFKGNVLGHPTQFKVSFTNRSFSALCWTSWAIPIRSPTRVA